MVRLIDADALMYAVDGNPLTTDSLKEYVRSTVKAQPTVDAVPVIRCRDCKFRMATKNRHKNKERIYCRLFFDPIEHHYFRCHDDDFCSRGERSRT